MVIDINVTLVVQMVHFLFALWLLRRFLWRPVVAVLVRQEQRKAHLERQFADQQQLIAQKQAEIDALWRDAQRSFLVNTPQFNRIVCVKSASIGPGEPQVAPDEALITAAAERLAKKACDHATI